MSGRAPVFLVPGLTGSALQVRMSRAKMPHAICSGDTAGKWQTTWLAPLEVKRKLSIVMFGIFSIFGMCAMCLKMLQGLRWSKWLQNIILIDFVIFDDFSTCINCDGSIIND